MSEQGLTGYQIQGYAQHLKLEEKSEATLEKYLRDIRAFAAWANGQKISKELTCKPVQDMAGVAAAAEV